MVNIAYILVSNSQLVLQLVSLKKSVAPNYMCSYHNLIRVHHSGKLTYCKVANQFYAYKRNIYKVCSFLAERKLDKLKAIWDDKHFKHFVAGGIAGAVSRTCVSPLERNKILLQVLNLWHSQFN